MLRLLTIVLAPTLLASSLASAADRMILGKKLLVKDPAGVESRRVVLGLGKEAATDITALVGDPTASGATLRVFANGTTPSDVTHALPAGGWAATATGFKYAGSIAGEPVKRVILKRTPGGVAFLKAILSGGTGTADLTVVPPDPGNDGGLTLEIAGGDRYCVSFGGAAGGSETADTGTLWKVVDPTAETACSAPPAATTSTTTVTPTSTSTTVAVACEDTTYPTCGGSCPVGSVCQAVHILGTSFGGGTCPPFGSVSEESCVCVSETGVCSGSTGGPAPAEPLCLDIAGPCPPGQSCQGITLCSSCAATCETSCAVP